MAVNKLLFFRKHTVHPAAAPASAPKPYGSWCSPDITPPPRTAIKRNDEQAEKNEETQVCESGPRPLQAEIKFEKTRIVVPKPGVQFRPTEADIEEAPIEMTPLAELLKIKKKLFNDPPEDDKPKIVVDSPQSPVPTSPSRAKKRLGFTLPSICDPYITIDPQGRGYISWLMLVTFCYSYNAWCIALRATFPYQTPENTPLWMMADYTCDLVYLLDVALVKPRLMFLYEGFWVDDPAETRKNYRKKLQYKFDIISLLPLDFFYLVFGTEMVILRLPRVLKLQTFWEFHQAMDRVLSSPYVVRIGKTLFYIFYLIHLNACAYYAMSVYEGLGSNGWVYDDQGNAYIRCFYFATKTATSIGKNPKPENVPEYLFMTFAWLMGVFVFALLIGQIRYIIATATRARTEYRKRVDGCTRYLRELNMPTALQRRVTAWYDYTWHQQRCFDESKILNSLPYNMKRDVALEVHMKTLSKVQLFTDCSDSLIRDLVLELRPVSFLPGDVVVRRGDVGHHMYIIKSGECCVMSHDEKEVLATLRESAVFGEISLLGIDGLRRRTATVVSRGFSSLYALSRYDLESALQQHEAAARILRRRADQLIRENAARQTRERLQERQARKSASTASESGLRQRRRLSSASSADSAPERRDPARRRLSVLSENMPVSPKHEYGLHLSCTGLPTPLPTIVFSSDDATNDNGI
ncbi:cyclic nucleotide-gated cation channel beta-1 isoform X1 [Plutella xylostella]|uniref:cyclic nucleotide-gated cation channel beta-1 isoform X1 n=1 Tax=Plutella xylostella TaxID=51655 RepID=UPI0020321D0F|nr:cyclic nucleotide-gated cation channel beta-1 isoform X1 [Plutella xylostella]